MLTLRSTAALPLPRAARRWINQDGKRGEPTIANDATVSSDLVDKSKTEKDSCVCEIVRCIFAEALARYGVQSRDLRAGTGESAAESGMTITAPQSKLRARRKFANRPNGRLRSCHHFATPRDLCRRDRVLALRRSRGSSEGVSGKDRAPLSSNGDHRGARRMVARAARAAIDSATAS
jgi:hypothetical protein